MSDHVLLTNKFHKTEYQTRKTMEELIEIADNTIFDSGRYWREGEKARRYARRVEKRLCGIKGCRCAVNVFGSTQWEYR